MKVAAVGLLALASSVAQAHYVFPTLSITGATTAAWQYVRQYPTYYTNSPVTNASATSSLDIRCNVGGSSLSSQTLPVKAGDNMTFTSTPAIYHVGPALVYMAAVPAGETAATFDGEGAVWFKVYQLGPTNLGSGAAMEWGTDSAPSVSFVIPAATPSGEYLVRMEHIALHTASTVGGAQFYISCGQVSVTDGGNGTPGPLVAFPGAYSPTDPGIEINVYYPIPTTYTFPGPAVWTG